MKGRVDALLVATVADSSAFCHCGVVYIKKITMWIISKDSSRQKSKNNTSLSLKPEYRVIFGHTSYKVDFTKFMVFYIHIYLVCFCRGEYFGQ